MGEATEGVAWNEGKEGTLPRDGMLHAVAGGTSDGEAKRKQENCDYK